MEVTIDKTNKLIICKESTNITLYEFGEYVRQVLDVCSKYTTFNILLNCNNAIFNFLPSNAYLVISNYFKEHIELLENKRIGIIVNEPRSTAMCILSASKLKEFNISIRVFSTIKAAKSWLLQ